MPRKRAQQWIEMVNLSFIKLANLSVFFVHFCHHFRVQRLRKSYFNDFNWIRTCIVGVEGELADHKLPTYVDKHRWHLNAFILIIFQK